MIVNRCLCRVHSDRRSNLVSGPSLPAVGARAVIWRHSCRSNSRTGRQVLRCTAGARVARYYDPSTAQFLTRDPIEPVTQQPYQYANGDPLDEVDPLGLWGWNPLSDIKQAAGDASNFVSDHATGIEVGVGIAVGVAAAATGVGAVIEAAGVAAAVAGGAGVAEASTGALLYGSLAAAGGLAAVALDGTQCQRGNQAACFGRDLGAVGAGTGLISLAGTLGPVAGLWGVESLPASIFGGLGTFSATFGIAASVFDLTTGLADASALADPSAECAA